ncbi:MAG: cysteine--1-D-myo-inosityl 2-amino-2-deoxy-alpha-D-glucopyranoside ligase [Actinomycetota bacterium]|nr:cysteine--1-D-myo-inosityl 2-amino-2-deoxy-alpha-D-glucopyranoside ligase [Nocardioidaceae bacterium]MDQ3480134.1 cysteine--1-D-myo-inosityl 2-amino-2-deoxy-alpha-D-glucopyranoside ligase [Actinomycetota bacterium]
MRSWASPPSSTAARDRLGVAQPLSLYDARTGAPEPTKPGDPARLYVCGITPYDATHLGHAATYLAFDLAIRAWREAGHEVRYVQNVTDVDDPLLERATATGQGWMELAERETELFREDMTALNMIAPDLFAGAVESIPLVVDLIKRLQERGAVYAVDGDLYFSVTTDPAFGSVSGLSRDEMLVRFAENGGDPERPGKRDPLDCLLWQRQREGEPAWESDLGTGRPGWHIECAAIARHHLGGAFDVQGGGSDLVFPHHEMSAGEAQVAHPGEVFAKGYSHAGMVGYEGHKMSKSRGNLVLVSRLRTDGVDPRAIRLSLLAHHYREDWEWTDEALSVGEKRLARWVDAVARGGVDSRGAVSGIRSMLAGDLNAPAALAAVDAWAADDGSVVDGAAELVAEVVNASLGIRL